MRPAFTRCLSCAQAVRPQQHALQCDGCDRWQHRLCDTGISLELYRATMRGEDGLIAWFCRDCSIPHHTSELDTTEEPPVLELSNRPPSPVAEPRDDPPVLYSFLDDDVRVDEVANIGGVPRGIQDIWEMTGQRPEAAYTWDMSRNDNKVFPGKFKPKLRFDRLYIRGAKPPTVEPVYFELVGLERVAKCGKFPSDHWGLLTHFNILSKVKNDASKVK